MKIVISGGGIGGLTAALMAKKMGFKTTVIQAREHFDLHSFGGGIGLWPPSQMVMQRLGVLDQLQKESLQMPDPEYMNFNGKTLAKPSKHFESRYKIICLERNVLTKVLLNACKQSGVELINKTTVQDFSIEKDQVRLQLSNGSSMMADSLIGADGINSVIRTKMLEMLGEPKVQPKHCEYAYFRAVVDLTQHPQLLETYQKVAFQSWGERKRFGYVPLKSPKTFWFVAIPIGEAGLQKYKGSHIMTPQSKQWLLNELSHWKGKIDIKKLIQISSPYTILRTDIRKMEGITKFSWSTKDGRVILMGDSANATAPNLAQGAGLAIESAWDMFSMIDFRNKNQGLQKYLKHRKSRAYTVQSIADSIAYIGQLDKALSTIRDFSMMYATKLLPSIQARIFETSVRYSTGGDNSQKHWLPFINTEECFVNNIKQENCLLGSIIGAQEFNKLPQLVRKFRSSMVGKGKGKVSVKTHKLARILGLPNNMEDQPFGAYVDLFYQENSKQIQKWTRVFGEGTTNALAYQTVHRAGVDFSSDFTGLTLTESIGLGPDIVRFGYDVQIKGNKVYYETKNIWLRNINIRLPKWLLPVSKWNEEFHDNGWNFHGTISMPKIIGGAVLMEYKGMFQPQLKQEMDVRKKVVIAGGSGMIGSIVCKQFYQKGWKVQVLSRNKVRTMNDLPFVTVHKWNPEKGASEQNLNVLKYCLEDADVIINLSGQNPGKARWNDKQKQKIINSRVNSIQLLSEGLNLCTKKQRNIIQASAAGIYGDRGQETINDESPWGQENTFRIQCCKKIEQETKNLFPGSIITRFGHVLSSKDGLYPYLKIAALCGVKKLGSKDRYIPWVHVEDVAGAIVHCADSPDAFRGKQLNIASPEHHTYSEVLKFLADLKHVYGFRRFGVPDFLVKLALGEMASVLLDSQRMNPKILLDNGYKFKFQSLEKAVLSKQCL